MIVNYTMIIGIKTSNDGIMVRKSQGRETKLEVLKSIGRYSALKS
jgi:hypothetical protein